LLKFGKKIKNHLVKLKRFCLYTMAREEKIKTKNRGKKIKLEGATPFPIQTKDRLRILWRSLLNNEFFLSLVEPTFAKKYALKLPSIR